MLLPVADQGLRCGTLRTSRETNIWEVHLHLIAIALASLMTAALTLEAAGAVAARAEPPARRKTSSRIGVNKLTIGRRVGAREIFDRRAHWSMSTG